jgi:hypothetical protein
MDYAMFDKRLIAIDYLLENVNCLALAHFSLLLQNLGKTALFTQLSNDINTISRADDLLQA